MSISSTGVYESCWKLVANVEQNIVWRSYLENSRLASAIFRCMQRFRPVCSTQERSIEYDIVAGLENCGRMFEKTGVDIAAIILRVETCPYRRGTILRLIESGHALSFCVRANPDRGHRRHKPLRDPGFTGPRKP